MISGTDAQILINELLNLVFNKNIVIKGMIKFNTTEMHDLFGFLNYPYVIRNDAITAVGAPSTI